MRVKEHQSEVEEIHRSGHFVATLDGLPSTFHLGIVVYIIDDDNRLVVRAGLERLVVTQGCIIRMIGINIDYVYIS